MLGKSQRESLLISRTISYIWFLEQESCSEDWIFVVDTGSCAVYGVGLQSLDGCDWGLATCWGHGRSSFVFFIFCWPCISLQILANNQLEALFHVFSRSGGNCSSLLTGVPISHLHRLIIPDDVLIQFDLLMMSIVILETCREMK